MDDIVISIDAVGTVLPPFKVPQTHALEFAQQNTAQDNVSPLLPRIYKNSAIENRHMSIPDFSPDSPPEAEPFFKTAAGEDGSFDVPLEDRFDKFREIASQMVRLRAPRRPSTPWARASICVCCAAAAPWCTRGGGRRVPPTSHHFCAQSPGCHVARPCLPQRLPPTHPRAPPVPSNCAPPTPCRPLTCVPPGCPGPLLQVIDATTKALAEAKCEPADVKRIIIASSTGFLAPGLETVLVDKMGFSRDAHMSFLGFMGCAASVSGIRCCTEFCKSEPGQKALVIAIDLASPHASFGGGINEAVLHAIFADGAAAIVLTGVRRSEVKAGQVTIDGHFSHLFEGSLDGILLKCHSKGVTCVLSKYLPNYIKQGLAPVVLGYLKSRGLDREDVDHWIVHPGGTRIVEACQASLDLPESELHHSWEVLRDHGNMLGPCVMFVLEKFMEESRQAIASGDTNSTVGMCFSFAPGVRVEGLLLQFNATDAAPAAVTAGSDATGAGASAGGDSAPTGSSVAVPKSVWPSFVPSVALAAYFAATTKLERLDSVSAGLAVASVAGLSLLTRLAISATPRTEKTVPSRPTPLLAAGMAAAAVAAAVAAGMARSK